MDKAEHVFEKLSFPKVLKNLKDISKYKDLILRQKGDASIIKPISTRKAIKKALSLLQQSVNS